MRVGQVFPTSCSFFGNHPHLVALVDAVDELGAGGVPGEADGGGVGGLSLHIPWRHRGHCQDKGTAQRDSSTRSPPSANW